MNTRSNSVSDTNHYLNNAEDRKTLSVLVSAVYSPLLLLLVAAFFLA